MKRYLFALIALTSLSIFSTSCSDDDNNTVTPPGGDSTGYVTLKGDISANQTLTADKKYILNSFVYVKSGVTLTIEPGTVIMGDRVTKGTLIVSRGGKLMAEGTAAKPIVFTSSMAAGARREGDWGGVIILGKAKINTGEAKIEGNLTVPAGADEKAYFWYGGNDDADNSGSLKYIRIEFAGISFSADNEINGLTMGGVGNGTKISYVQIYRSGDDAFEWFGGSVNCDHLVATASLDDDFDTDNGFSGKVQFGVAQRYKSIADQSGSNGFESDNDANGSANAPQTSAIFSNMTIVGPYQAGNSGTIDPSYQHAAQIRRNSAISIHNSILMGFPFGLYIDDTKVSVAGATSQNAIDGRLVFKNNIIAGCGTNFKGDWINGKPVEWNTFLLASATTTLDSVAKVLLKDPYKFSAAIATTVGTPSFLLNAGSPALIGASFEGITTGFTQVTYRGAFDGTTDWTAGWTTASAETTVY